MGWTGAKPRKLSCNINFSKPTNRDGNKLLILKKMLSPSEKANGIEGGGIVVMSPGSESKRPKKHLIGQMGPCVYSPRFDAVEGKRGKSIQNWELSL